MVGLWVLLGIRDIISEAEMDVKGEKEEGVSSSSNSSSFRPSFAPNIHSTGEDFQHVSFDSSSSSPSSSD